MSFEHDIKINGIYKHYKGNLYQVIALAKHSETEEDMVVYKPLNSETWWVRPAYMWSELVNNVPRFALLPDD